MNPYMINGSSTAQPSPQQQIIGAATTHVTEADQTSADIPRAKRSRAKRSCDLCRKRKTRCNADVVQPCNTCQSAGVQCEFLVEQKKRGPNARNYVGTLESRLKRLEGLLQKAQSSEPHTETVQGLASTTNGATATDKALPQEQPQQPQQQQQPTQHDSSSGSRSSSNSPPPVGEDFMADCIDENRLSNSQISTTSAGTGAAPSLNHVCKSLDAAEGPTIKHTCGELLSVDPSLELVEHLNQLQLSDYERTRYIGGSAGYHMIDQHLFKKNWRHRIRSHPNWVVQKVNDDDTEHVIIKAEEMRHMPTMMAGKHALLRFSYLQDIPSITPELVDCMIHAFFNHIHPHCPILNKVSFLEQYYFQNPHEPDEYLLYAICAVATQFLSMEDDLVTGTTVSRETVVSVRNNLRERANKILEVVYKRSQISTVQTLILLSMFVSMAQDDDDDSVHWFITGTAIRMAQDLGLHRSSTRWLLPEHEIELRRRIWYAVYVMDKWIAAELGRPVAILDEEFDVELPSVYEITSIYHSELRDAQLRHMKPALLLDAETALKEKRPVYAAFLHMISLARTLGQVLVSLYSPKMQYAARRNIYLVDTLNMALTRWKMSVPPDLQCEDNKPDKAFPNGGMMHIFYNCVVLLLHRPFIMDQDSANINHALQSLSTCTAAAINIIDTVEALENMGVICMPWCMVGYATFQAAIVFLFNARSDNAFIRRQGAKNLMRCAWAYKKDECMSRSRTSNVLCQLARRFCVPIVAEETELTANELCNDYSSGIDRSRKRDYEGDSVTSRRSSSDKQPRTALGFGNTSEEAIYYTSLPREMGFSTNSTSASSENLENSDASIPKNSSSSRLPLHDHSCCTPANTANTIMDMFYPTEEGSAKNGSATSAQSQQQPGTEPLSSTTATTAAPNHDSCSYTANESFSQQPEGTPPQQPQPVDSEQRQQQLSNNMPSAVGNIQQDIDSLLMGHSQQQPHQHQNGSTDTSFPFEAPSSSILNQPIGSQFDLASLASDVPMWNLPSGVTWSEWDSLLNDANAEQVHHHHDQQQQQR
ncbi:fungal-specific transcription factor domain-containing protein [Zychaea mexicana]|uniref:fungal-specific transcription factor domain-containing protein n=1 Tax=Zychaea mexicana TaxID=64656 RepID=UPI0022FE2AEA|nr:fungal-specific transcription factor domain-containing protein [Zychaea mexicana]KAI9494489.1 fungal-specific transcription factor domain-containing protein [Zychaea mexicana]